MSFLETRGDYEFAAKLNDNLKHLNKSIIMLNAAISNDRMPFIVCRSCRNNGNDQMCAACISTNCSRYEQSDINASKDITMLGVTSAKLKKAQQCLADNGIEPDECETVIQALFYILFDVEAYPERGDGRDS